MIGFIKGRVLQKNADPPSAVLRSGGLGLEVHLTRETYERLVEGETAELWLHLQVREDAMTLYGFATDNEKKLFRVLLTASGLGPKTALSLLAEHGPRTLIQLISRKDSDAISSAPGVGKKLAQKLILELGTKVEKLEFSLEALTSAVAHHAPVATKDRDVSEDLTSALSNLGFAPVQIKSVLDRLRDREDWGHIDFETGLRTALKDLSGRIRPLEGASHG